jgi:hypothetical protein
VPGLKTDGPFKAPYEGLSTSGLESASMRSARVAQVSIGEHDGFFVINRRNEATGGHPFLVRRGDEWGFCAADQLPAGDRLITAGADGTLGEEAVNAIERVAGRVRTVALYVPGTNTYLADGAHRPNRAKPARNPGFPGGLPSRVALSVPRPELGMRAEPSRFLPDHRRQSSRTPALSGWRLT